MKWGNFSGLYFGGPFISQQAPRVRHGSPPPPVIPQIIRLSVKSLPLHCAKGLRRLRNRQIDGYRIDMPNAQPSFGHGFGYGSVTVLVTTPRLPQSSSVPYQRG